jgi:predicted phage tail protein
MLFEFPDEFDLKPLQIEPYNLIDLFAAVRVLRPDYPHKIIEYSQKYDFQILDAAIGETIDICNLDAPLLSENIKLELVPSGGGTVGKIIGGIALLGLGLSGVGLLGISATTLSLTGAGLLFSSIFKHPKSDTKAKSEKRSINFSGVVNVTGSGNILPRAYGLVSIGSIVVSGEIVPYDSAV